MTMRFLWNAARAALLIALMVTLGACDGMLNKASANESTKAKMATVYGYNYTDLYISSFSVNGQGGGNLAVSSPTGGGGGSVCCVMVRPNQKLTTPVTVRWTRDAYTKVWCELDVMLKDPVPPNPEYFEVHFYQDGHVEVAVTEETSEPRVKLPRFNYAERHETGNVNNDTKFARCTNGG
jgi:hypothetical protein